MHDATTQCDAFHIGIGRMDAAPLNSMKTEKRDDHKKIMVVAIAMQQTVCATNGRVRFKVRVGLIKTKFPPPCESNLVETQTHYYGMDPLRESR